MCVDRNRNRIGAFCLITLAFLVCISCTKPIKSAPEATVVQVSKIESQGFQPVLSLEGELEAISRHELSFLVPGKLISLLVKEGDKVKKGQLLASLESSDYQEALAIAEAKLAEANDQYQRLSNMYASGSLPEADLNKIKSLRNEAEANYNLYKNKKSYTELKAALNGSISKIWARQGMTVDQGQPVLTLLNTDELVAKVGVPEKSIDFIQVGEEAMILIPSLGDTLMGKVNLINPAASRLTRTFEVEVTFPQNERIKDGMLCEVRLQELLPQSEILIPLGLVHADGDGIQYVFLAEKGVAKRRRVLLGKLVENQVVVEKGLSPGDLLILNPAIDLLDGMPVTF